MKSLRFLAAGLILLVGLAATPAAPVRVDRSQIDAENAKWTSLGVKLPPGGIVLPNPYAAPYSNRSFVVPTSWYRDFAVAMRAKNGVSVNAASLRDDLPVLKFLVQKAYAGYEPAQRHGWNWNAMFRDWDAQLSHAGDKGLTLKEAFAPWGKLENVQLDNHSGVPGLRDFMSGSASAQLAGKPAGGCSALRFGSGPSLKLAAHDAGQQPHAVRAWDGTKLSAAWYVSYPQRLGTASAIVCAGKAIALTTVPQSQPSTAAPEYRTLADGIAYLRLPTFNDANDEAIHATLEKAVGLGKERLVIFDLRGNDGGNAPTEILSDWFAGSQLDQAGNVAQHGTRSCFATGLFFGLQQQLAAGLKPPVSPALTQQLQSMVDGLQTPATPDCSVQPYATTATHSLRDHHFSIRPDENQTRIVALVDNGCGSDCEFMTYMLGRLPNTVIAGTSTFGIMGFTQPGYFVLPYSRVPFRLALSRTDSYGDGRSVDGYGITVDILLPTAASQSQQSLTALAQLLAGRP